MTKKKGLQKITCAICKGDIVKSYRTVDEDEEAPIARCLSCGKEFDQHTKEFYEYFAGDYTKDVGNSVLKLGLKGTLKGVEYEIIGRIRMQEEDEYEKCTWDEWEAVSSDGVYHYFVEEDGEINSYEEYVPESIDMESGGPDILFEGRKVPRDEVYTGRIVFVEGELTWKPLIGEAIRCWDFKKEGHRFTIEQTENEVSITRGDRITYKEIIEAFGGQREKELYEETATWRRRYRHKSLVYLAGFIIALFLSIYSCSTGTEVKNVMTGKTVLETNAPVRENNINAFSSQVIYGPFDLDRGRSLYDVDVFIDERIQALSLTWESFRLLLLKEERLKKVLEERMDAAALKNLFSEIDAQREPVESFAVAGDFWDEKGVDDEGAWHESDLRASTSFILDEPGKYYAYLELTSEKKRNVDSVKISIARAASVRYYIIAAVIMAALCVVNWVRAGMFRQAVEHSRPVPS